jgi:hypothetical protein
MGSAPTRRSGMDERHVGGVGPARRGSVHQLPSRVFGVASDGLLGLRLL